MTSAKIIRKDECSPERMAYLLGEQAGETVGYRMRFESKAGGGSFRWRYATLRKNIPLKPAPPMSQWQCWTCTGAMRGTYLFSSPGQRRAVSPSRERRIGRLLIEEKPLHNVRREDIVRAVCEAAPKEGLSMFDFGDEVQNLQRRIAAARAWGPGLDLPDCTTDSILRSASEWLPLYMGNASTAADLKTIDMSAVILNMLSWEQQKEVERLAPSHIEVPTGSRIRVEYRQGADAPVLKVRLQECFGMQDTRRVNGGKTPVVMELLSPGFKPVQLTGDLASFWKETYFEVR